MINLSAWDSKTKPQFSNPDFVRGKVEMVFGSKNKVVVYQSGEVSLRAKEKQSNSRRDEVISGNLSNTKFRNISEVYTPVTEMSGSEQLGWEVYSHGEPQSSGTESCEKYRLLCASGSGTNRLCSRGKCVIGRVERVKKDVWKYTSAAEYENEKYIYYVRESADHTLELKSVVRGSQLTYSSTKDPIVVNITSPASAACTVLTPPSFYFGDLDFITEPIVKTDNRLRNVEFPEEVTVTGLLSRKENFISRVVSGFFNAPTQAVVTLKLKEPPSEEFVEYYSGIFSELNPLWFGLVKQTILNSNSASVFDLLSETYDSIFELFKAPHCYISSGVRGGKVDYFEDYLARPVYARLPGIAEAYRVDPAGGEGPTQWLVSGVDEFLSEKKDQMSNFYYNSLNPDTCGSQWLNWLAQHVGLFGPLWNTSWNRKTKATLIKNAFGWWDQNSDITLSAQADLAVSTQKGEVLNSFPFSTDELWVEDEGDQTYLNVYLDRVETLTVETSTKNIVQYSRYVEKSYNSTTDLLSLVPTNSIKFYKHQWGGLIPSKGSMLCVAFLCSVFDLKAFTPLEVEVLDAQKKIVKPKSGLRQYEEEAPTLLPYYCAPLQVGSDEDLEINNYENQLVAGISLVHDLEDTKDVVFRMPFYYNRNGRHWKDAEYIAKNWMPNNVNARVQYPYLCADLWVVGDLFFEPEIVTV